MNKYLTYSHTSRQVNNQKLKEEKTKLNKHQAVTRYINKLAVSGLRRFELLIKFLLNRNGKAIKCQSIHIATVGNHARPTHIQAHFVFAIHKAKQKKRKELVFCQRTKEKHNTMKQTTVTTNFMLGKNKFI